MSAPKVDGYFQLADRGLKTANILFREDQMEDAALNIQQVIERVARGLLTHAGIPFGTSHNLGQMATSLPSGHKFAERIKAFDDLSTAVTAYRYPTDAGRLKKAPPAEVLLKKLEAADTLLRDAKVYVYGADAKHWPTDPPTKKSDIR
jgi:HEPN domain-containing protein